MYAHQEMGKTRILGGQGREREILRAKHLICVGTRGRVMI